MAVRFKSNLVRQFARLPFADSRVTALKPDQLQLLHLWAANALPEASRQFLESFQIAANAHSREDAIRQLPPRMMGVLLAGGDIDEAPHSEWIPPSDPDGSSGHNLAALNTPAPVAQLTGSDNSGQGTHLTVAARLRKICQAFFQELREDSRNKAAQEKFDDTLDESREFKRRQDIAWQIFNNSPAASLFLAVVTLCAGNFGLDIVFCSVTPNQHIQVKGRDLELDLQQPEKSKSAVLEWFKGTPGSCPLTDPGILREPASPWSAE